MVYFNAVMLALVEGITEFLPVSSTGHLILVENILPLTADPAFNAAFLVIIQLPAVLSVVVYFWNDLWPFSAAGEKRKSLYRLWFHIAIAVLPAAVLGLLLDDIIERHLFAPRPVAVSLLVGGIVLIVVEKRPRQGAPVTLSALTPALAVYIGLFQCLALVPGTSRSGATIIGAMILGLGRASAAEFSFFLAIPTMAGATMLKLAKGGYSFTAEQWSILALGSAVSFVSAYAVIHLYLGYVRKRDFIVFGYYRIALALVIFACIGFGWV